MEWGLEGRDLLLARPGSQAGRPCQVGGRLPRALSLQRWVLPTLCAILTRIPRARENPPVLVSLGTQGSLSLSCVCIG